MRSKMYIQASSLLEAVIAIAIISLCLSIGLSVFVKVTNVVPPVDYYTLDSKLKESLALKTDSQGLLANNLLDKLGESNANFESNNDLSTEIIQVVHKADTLDFTLLLLKKTEQ